MSGRAEAAVEEILGREEDADDVLRAVVAALVEQGACRYAAIRFSEEGELVSGPEAGSPEPATRTSTPVVWEGIRVAELETDGCDDPGLPERVAEAIAELCLVGWDTGGDPWDADA